MKRRHLFRTELKYDFGNRRFYISVLALCAVLLIVALPYRNHLIAFGGSTEGEAMVMHLHLCNHFRKSLAFLSTVGSSGNSRRYTGRITQPLCMVSY